MSGPENRHLVLARLKINEDYGSTLDTEGWEKMDRLASMAAFVTATDLGSFAAAAAQLRQSPQMVAKHVTFLEHRLGSRLLNRTTRRQSLTEVGRTYYERCKIVLAEADAADALAQETRAVPRGRLKVSAPVTFGAHSLMPLITRYLRDHPEVAIDLALTDRFVDLVEEGHEVVFRVGPLDASGLVGRALSPYRLAACASPAYLRERGTPATPEDLIDHECLGYAYWPRPAEDEWYFVRDGRKHTVSVRSRLQVNDSRALMAAAIDGYGVVMGPEDVLRDALTSGQLVSILTDFTAPSRPMHLLYVADRRQTPKLRSFIDSALRTFG